MLAMSTSKCDSFTKNKDQLGSLRAKYNETLCRHGDQYNMNPDRTM